MGVYIVTGGSGGIGGKTVEILRNQGHEVLNVDLKDADICANLATKEGRDYVIDTVHEMFPDGIDGLCCNAGVSGACGNLKLIVSLNYYGAVNLAHGLFDLLKKKGGSCVVTSSNTISQGAARPDLVDLLNYSQTKTALSEEAILKIVEKFDDSNLSVGNSIYVTTKYALARWVRRVSASWAANGVRINTVAPGNVSTPMTATMSTSAKAALAALPIPINYGTDELMNPEDIANVIVFLVSPLAHGVNGNVMFVDGGTDALLNSEKVY
ncbi:MAG: SDR family oxidoreductase [Ruminiclostridium sp.]|nr:SDR family oxidoreductase [Ruminiclostridium sp.]